MTATDWVALGALVIILAVAIVYIVRAKKKGAKCIGCPHACECQKKNCSGKGEEK